MFRGALRLALLLLAACQSWGQDTLPDPMRPYNRTADRATEVRSAPRYHLSAVLISPTRKVAVVNGKPYREGDEVDGATVLTIASRSVRMRAGNRELTVELGTRRAGANPRVSTTRASPQPRPTSALQPEAEAPTERPADVLRGEESGSRVPVRKGDTLSGIAQRHRPEGVTLNQMMMALFEANPQAFNGNINMLYAGAVLRVPLGEALQAVSPGMATLEVTRQTDEWRTGVARQVRAPPPPERGPAKFTATIRDVVTAAQLSVWGYDGEVRASAATPLLAATQEPPSQGVAAHGANRAVHHLDRQASLSEPAVQASSKTLPEGVEGESTS